MKSTLVFIGVILVVVALIAGVGYLLRNQNAQIGSLSTSPSPTSGDSSVSVSPADDEDMLRAGGSSYRDPNGVFTILYPSEYAQDSPGTGMTRLFKTGATQTGQTEMYDGVIIHLESADLGGKTLSSWVDAKIKEATADGTSEVTKPKAPTTLNGYPGFTYNLRGLGESTYLVIQKDTNSDNTVVITTLVADPQSKGYQEEVDATLATLELLK